MKIKSEHRIIMLCVYIFGALSVSAQGIIIGSSAFVKTAGAAYIVVNNGNLTNNGNWTSNGTDIVTLSGTAAKQMTGSGTTAFYDLTLTNMGGITQKLRQINAHNLNISSGSGLSIDTCKAMVVSNIVTNQAGAAGIYIKSSTDRANGSLIFHNNVSSPVSATVEMYTKASNSTNYKWQFFGIPLRSVAISPTFNGSYIRRFNEAGWYAGFNSTNLWIQLSNGATLTSFTGYEITQLSPKTFVFSGQLENSDFSTGKLPVSTPEISQYPGQHLFGNPYTGAIDIKKIQFGSTDAGIIENSVYLYNTGSYADWQNAGSGSVSGTSPGQYVCIPQNQAGNAGIPAQIPSMQAFLVYAKSDNVAANLVIPYSSVGTVVRNTDPQRNKRQKTDLPASKTYTMIDVVGSRYSDRMWIFTEPTCTKAFDNGWDGYKFIGSSSSVPQIWSMEGSDNYQVNSLNNIDSTTIGFIPGEDTAYQLVFTNENTQNSYPTLFLVDLVTKNIVDVSQNGSTYNFTSSVATPDNSRFKLYKSFTTASLSLGLPTIIVSGSLSAVHTSYSVASPSPSVFKVSGRFLTHDITLTAPTGYEISTTNGGLTNFSTTQNLTQSGGEVVETTIYVRLAVGIASGTYSGNISCVSADASTVNVPTVSSNVNPVVLTITGLTGTNKSYDGNNSAAFTGTPAYSGLVNGESFSVTGTPLATFADASVGNNKAITIIGFTAPTGNYTVTQPTLNATVSAIAVTVSTNTNCSALTNLPGTDLTITGAELTVDSNVTIHNLTVSPGAELTLNDTKTLNVSGNLTVKSNLTGTGTIVDMNANSGLTVSGTTTVEQYLSSARNWYISSPVSNARAKSGYTYYSRDEANNVWITLNTGDGVTTGDLFNVGQGYVAYLASGTSTYSFNGTLNSGSQHITVNRTGNQATKPGFNLVGNPFPSYVNAGTVVNASAGLEKTIWYRSQIKNTSIYTFDTYNTIAGLGINNSKRNSFVTGTVPPMQAFWVRVAEFQPSATLNFLSSYCTHASDTVNLLKSRTISQTINPVLRMEVSNGVNADEAVLYSTNSASNGYDSYDSRKMSNSSAAIPEIYFPVGAEQLAINGMKDIPFGHEIALGFTTLKAEQFSIRASQIVNFTAGIQVILNDYLNPVYPVITDLTDGRSYSFSSEICGDNTTRFKLVFRVPSIVSEVGQPGQGYGWISTNSQGQLVVNNIKLLTSVNVYNELGQKITSEIVNSSTFVLKTSFTPGVYLVAFNNAGKCETVKVVLK